MLRIEYSQFDPLQMKFLMAFLFLTAHRLLAWTRSAAYNTQQEAANKNIAQWSQRGWRKEKRERIRECERGRRCARKFNSQNECSVFN